MAQPAPAPAPSTTADPSDAATTGVDPALAEAPGTVPVLGATPGHHRVPTPDPDLDVRLPTPGSIVWESVGDLFSIATLVPALVLQAAHPTISAGLVDHSIFRTDPWRRLSRSFFPIVALSYDEDPVGVGTRIRDRHRAIKGVRPDGTRYHALHPDAYWFVLATGFEALVEGHARYGRPLTPAQTAEAYAEYRTMWLLVGLGDAHVPESVDAFWDAYETMIATALERTDSVEHVFEALRTPAVPPLLESRPGRALWRLVRAPISRVTIHQTTWQLRPAVRELLGLDWTVRDERRARRVARAIRAASAVTPRPLRLLPPAFRGNRREGTLWRVRPGRPRATGG